MLFKIAWRNIWRNKVRSMVVITALALGLWAGIFVSAFVNGMMRQKIDSVIEIEMSHFQLHKMGFRDEYLIRQYMENGLAIRQELLKDSLVDEVAARTVGMMMFGTAKRTDGMKVTGISPEEEKAVTHLDEKIVEGKYFEGVKSNPVLISKKTSEKYKARLKSKIVLTFQDVNGEIVAAAFRVCGIYESGNAMYDNSNVFVRREDIQNMSGIGGGVHELAVLLKAHEPADAMARKYQKIYPELEVLSWKDLSSGMRYMIGVMGIYTVMIVGIVLLAMLFSIINTMMMAVLERIKEIGMLMAVGMNRKKVFVMIMLETIFMSLVGGPAGLLLAWTSVSYFGQTGIDLGNAAYGDLGFSNLIYPSLEGNEYIKVTVMVFTMALLAAIYPARKAINLKPIEAMQKI